MELRDYLRGIRRHFLAILIMTALGLGVAIPAVLAYNFFVRLNRVSNSQFDTFAHDLHDFFATGSRVGEVAGKR